MKWRHSKEAQAQKDKEKEQPDKAQAESDQKGQEESDCESEHSESDFEEGPEDKSDVDVTEHNKTSVIMSGPPSGMNEDTTPSNALTETPASSQILS